MVQVQLQRPQRGAGRVLQRRRLPRHLGSVESETQRWAREERRQDPAHRQPCGYYFLSTYEVSDSGMSALPPTLAQFPLSNPILQIRNKAPLLLQLVSTEPGRPA